ncbi:hypothetical protein IAT38_000557 [Cryptococcus sp. DSM 104549]
MSASPTTTSSTRPSTPVPFTHTLHHGHQSSYFQPHAYTAQPLHFHMQRLPQPTPPSLLQRQASLKRTTATAPPTSTRVRTPLLPSSVPSSPSRAVTSLSITIPASSRPHASSSGSRPASPQLISPMASRSSVRRSSALSIASPPTPSTPILDSPTLPFSAPTPLQLPSPVVELDCDQLATSPTSTLREEERDEVEVVDFGRPTREDWARCWELEGEGTMQCVKGLAAVSRAARQTTKPVLKRRDTPRPSAELASSKMSGLSGREAEDRRLLRSALDGGGWEVRAARA